MLDFIIRRAKIIDGTGSPWFRGDIGIKADTIVRIGHRIDEDAKRAIDVSGHVAAPGFIDMHSHSDMRVLKHPEEDSKLMQGITTDLLAQDGLSLAPIDPANKDLMKKRVSGLLGTYIQDWSWQSLGEYLELLEKVRPGNNKLILIPHSSIRVMAMGWDDRPATIAECNKMKQLVRECFQQGACGLSTGLIYPPAMFADREELIAILTTVGELGGFFVVHMRNESDSLLDAIQEVVDLCREAGCPLHISHLKIAGQRNWGKSVQVLELIDRTRLEGLDVTFDQYPYGAGSTLLDAVIPPWHHKGGEEAFLQRLKDPAMRKQIALELSGDSREFVNVVANSGGWGGIMISACHKEQNKFMEGKTIAELSRALGKEPVDMVAELLINEDSAVTMVNFYGHEDDIKLLMQHPAMCACTDGIVGGKPHPRVYGSFPRILGKYVREQKVLCLETAIQHMTANPARRLNLQDRGLLRTGMKADITVFDPDVIADTNTFADPNRYPVGVDLVFVNGRIAMENGTLAKERWGRVLRFQNGSYSENYK